MQQLVFSSDPAVAPLVLPAPNTEVMPGVAWGDVAEPFTPAYWRTLIHQGTDRDLRLTIGGSLLEEAAACLLGGYGIPAEVGLAAFFRLKALGLLVPRGDAAAILQALLKPLDVGGTAVRYRFAFTKAEALAELLERFANEVPPDGPLELRAWLTKSKGFGLKTASWVVRNFRDCDDVAVLDVHVLRAGYLMGLFPEKVSLPRDYQPMESRFVEFARRIGVRASRLDACIWAQMKRSGEFALDAVNDKLMAGRGSSPQRRTSRATKAAAR